MGTLNKEMQARYEILRGYLEKSERKTNKTLVETIRETGVRWQKQSMEHPDKEKLNRTAMTVAKAALVLGTAALVSGQVNHEIHLYNDLPQRALEAVTSTPFNLADPIGGYVEAAKNAGISWAKDLVTGIGVMAGEVGLSLVAIKKNWPFKEISKVDLWPVVSNIMYFGGNVLIAAAEEKPKITNQNKK